MKKPFVLAMVGADMCGKTQICAALSYALEVPAFKASSEHETFLAKQDLFLQQIRFAAPREVDLIAQGCIPAIIMDRAWPCEFAYAAYYGRPTDKNVLRYIDNRMAEFDAKVVICHRSSYEGIQDDLQPTLQGQHLMHIEGEYRKFARWTKCKTLFLNVDDEDIVRECTDVLSWLGHTGDRLDYLVSRVKDHDELLRSGQSACCV